MDKRSGTARGNMTTPRSGASINPQPNSTAQKRCYGFGERTNNCTNTPGGKWSPHFCPECDEARMSHLSSQFKKIEAGFVR